MNRVGQGSEKKKQKGRGTEDDLDGEGQEEYSTWDDGSTGSAGDDGDDDDDDVDKEEEEGGMNPARRREMQRSLDVEMQGEEATTSQRRKRRSRHHSLLRDEETGGDSVSSVDLDERKQERKLYREQEVDATSVHEEERKRKSSLGADALKTVRKRLRRSFDASGRGKPLFGISKENILRQKLPIVWQPLWNGNTAGRLFLVLSIFTLPLALYLFFTQLAAQEFKFTFGEECKTSRNYLRLIRNLCVFCGGNLNPHCSKLIMIREEMNLPVYLYYELEGIHQNHRMLAKSYDDAQLLGNIFKGNGKPKEPSENCGAYSRDKDGKIYFPCGQLANMMYNDEFALLTDKGYEVTLRSHGIAMNALKHYRFRNPPSITSKDYHLKAAFIDNFVKPLDWSLEMWDKWWKEGGMENERFINWMNPAPLAHFRKLYAVIDSVPECPPGIFCKGNYTMNIEYRYDIEKFNIHANKAFVLATSTHLGGQNYGLPLMVAIIGCVELLLGLLLVETDRFVNDIIHEMEELDFYQRQRRARLYEEEELGRVASTTDIRNVPQAVVDPIASQSTSTVTTFPITSEQEDPVPGPSGTEPVTTTTTTTSFASPEDLTYPPPISTLFRSQNPILPVNSTEVFPDDYFDILDWTAGTEDEAGEETGHSDTGSFTSVKSMLVSAEEDSSPERPKTTSDLRQRRRL